jgi:hypothetical protein
VQAPDPNAQDRLFVQLAGQGAPFNIFCNSCLS